LGAIRRLYSFSPKWFGKPEGMVVLGTASGGEHADILVLFDGKKNGEPRTIHTSLD
jgi:hypothetical protein